MSEELVEAVAKELKSLALTFGMAPNDGESAELARAALQAVEDSGTHVVMPIGPTAKMDVALAGAVVSGQDPWKAVLAARPKVIEP